MGATTVAAADRRQPPKALPPFEVLVTTHGTAVLRVCRAMVGLNDAEDIWQETFIAALRSYPASSEVRNREAWLITIARNKAIDHHRRAGRLPLLADPFGPGIDHRGDPEPSMGERHDGGDAVVHAAEAAADSAVIWAALAQLPPGQREAVVYHHLAGLPYAAVAQLLEKSEAAARRSASDGMKALRALLEPQEGTIDE